MAGVFPSLYMCGVGLASAGVAEAANWARCMSDACTICCRHARARNHKCGQDPAVVCDCADAPNNGNTGQKFAIPAGLDSG